ncbi:hypothetical protein HGH93_16625 [Chitinophaga polysaccharea]|uniref:hypothetical protein n=1 Tax=Chitinophaga TaxID=79328 RepID=UPI0014552A7E|nr:MULTISPECIES: hypothetical protein [Chitinophaga]NLR59737.1 hypothetical protein [Chitinophaga polysaccharea]NLU94090.1 hypothetical protein [Chitinophaga sp. Ak27]
MNYTQPEINELFLKFYSVDKYEERLKFYDNHFNILPFTLPDFETNLFTFFSEDYLQQFENLLRIERKNSESLQKTFFFEREHYTFSIKPGPAHYATFNNYIISRFLQADTQLKQKIQQELALIGESKTPVKTMLASVNEMLVILKRKVSCDNRRRLNTQFALVFLKGLTDFSAHGMPVIAPKRKKIIELYLYAQGIMYGEYIQLLKKNVPGQEEANIPFDKISLLKELGVIEAIRRKYPFLNKADMDKKIEEIIYLVTGERMAITAIR